MPDDEKPEAAPSGDVTENEDEQKPITKPVAIPEQIETHETAPKWLKAITDRLDKIEAGMKPAEPKVEPKAEPKTEPIKEQDDGQKKEEPKRKSGKVRLWRKL